MSGNHRTVAGSRRKPKKNTGLIALAGILVTSLVVVAIAAAIYVLGSSGDQSNTGNSNPTETGTGDSGAALKANNPKGGGPEMTLKSADGFGYSMIALDGKVGDGTAYVDYVLTNNSDQEAPLEEPGDLFITKSFVSEPARCMPQPGAEPTMCSVPNSTRVVGMVGGSKPPINRGGDKFMPARAAYKLRVTSDIAINPAATKRDLHLYVWDARFISDRRAHLVALP
jgi:hypothetical protein